MYGTMDGAGSKLKSTRMKDESTRRRRKQIDEKKKKDDDETKGDDVFMAERSS